MPGKVIYNVSLQAILIRRGRGGKCPSSHLGGRKATACSSSLCASLPRGVSSLPRASERQPTPTARPPFLSATEFFEFACLACVCACGVCVRVCALLGVRFAHDCGFASHVALLKFSPVPPKVYRVRKNDSDFNTSIT
jgi:hypothetical protein